MKLINLKDIIELDTIDGYSGGEEAWALPGDVAAEKRCIPDIVLTDDEPLHLPSDFPMLKGWRRKFYYHISQQ